MSSQNAVGRDPQDLKSYLEAVVTPESQRDAMGQPMLLPQLWAPGEGKCQVLKKQTKTKYNLKNKLTQTKITTNKAATHKKNVSPFQGHCPVWMTFCFWTLVGYAIVFALSRVCLKS